MDNTTSFKELIQSNIDQYGYHITIVVGGIQPRFAYSIGLYSQLNFELAFTGGIYYLKDEMFRFFREIVDHLRVRSEAIDQRIGINDLGEFSFLRVDQSWSKLML